MSTVNWDLKARDFLRKLPKDIALRIYRKVDEEIKGNVERYLETLIGRDGYNVERY